MNGFVDEIGRLTVGNDDFRRVVYTGRHLQLVLMTLAPGEEIGLEVHEDGDQFFRVEAGQGEIEIDGATRSISPEFAMVVPAGASHNVRCVGEMPLRLYTLYGPPEHRDGVRFATKAEAEAAHEHFDGTTTE
jgi:mannose-6-phosphate isomerase-like protein (cupin superfamily)